MYRKPFADLVVCVLLSLLLTACGGTGRTSSTPPATGGNAPSSGSPSTAPPGAGSGSAGGSSGSGSGTAGITEAGFAERKISLFTSGNLIAADFNRDGHLDLLLYGPSLTVLLNNGSGDFGNSISAPLPAPYTSVKQIALADFNSDGYPDVAACVNDGGPTGAAVVFLNDRSGKLTPGQVTALSTSCQGIAAGDVNRDGKADFSVTYFTGSFGAPNNTITTWLGDGAGHFASPTMQSNVMLAATKNSTVNPCSVAAATGADFDGDSILDLLLFGTCQSDVINPGNIYFAKGDGAGHYSLTEISESNTSVIGSPQIKDINGDGKPDVVFLQTQYGPHGSNASDLNYAASNGLGGFTVTRAASENAYAGSGTFLTAGTSLATPGNVIEGFSSEDCCGTAMYGVKFFAEGISSPTHTWIYGQASSSPLGFVTGIASGDFENNGTQDFAVVEENANHNATLHIYLKSN